MTNPITDHITNATSYHLLYISAADRGFAMLTLVPLKEAHAMYRKDDLIKIILIYV
jgi:hypothetical protein